MSVCQYLASEVHKPLTPPQTTPTPSLPISGGSKSKPKKNHSSGVAPPSQPSTNKATATSKTRVKPAPELPPPSPLVSQIMEMGFPRHHIEKAIEVSDVLFLEKRFERGTKGDLRRVSFFGLNNAKMHWSVLCKS